MDGERTALLAVLDGLMYARRWALEGRTAKFDLAAERVRGLVGRGSLPPEESISVPALLGHLREVAHSGELRRSAHEVEVLLVELERAALSGEALTPMATDIRQRVDHAVALGAPEDWARDITVRLLHAGSLARTALPGDDRRRSLRYIEPHLVVGMDGAEVRALDWSPLGVRLPVVRRLEVGQPLELAVVGGVAAGHVVRVDDESVGVAFRRQSPLLTLLKHRARQAAGLRVA